MPLSGEPLWLPDDADAVVALIEYEESLHDCGMPRDETFDRNREFAYEAKAYRCHACAAVAREQQRRSKDESSDTSGMYFVAVENEDAVMSD